MTDEPGRVLVVDDDLNNRDLLSRRLRRIGYQTAVADGGHAALEKIGVEDFDLVLLDVMMPGLDGFEVLKLIRADRAPTDLPVIMATAKDDSEDIVHALNLGANDYVTKPLDFPVVVARIGIQVSLKRAVDQVRRLERRLADRNQELEFANARMSRDLRAAARIQKSFLPRSDVETGSSQFSWSFRPCDELAGDGLNIIRFDDSRTGVYVLDVSGHGVPASLLSVSLGRLLSPPSDPSSILIRGGPGADRSLPTEPGEVANRLNRLFPFEVESEQYSTLVYGLVNSIESTFRYTVAGHPAPIHQPSGQDARALEGRGSPIGFADASRSYEEWEVGLSGGDRIFLFSDGIPDAANESRQAFGAFRLLEWVDRYRDDPIGDAVEKLIARVEEWVKPAGPRDDISILAFEFWPDGPEVARSGGPGRPTAAGR